MIISIEVEDTFIFKEEWKGFSAVANGQAISHGFSALLLAAGLRQDITSIDSESESESDKKVYDLQVELRLTKAQCDELRAQYEDLSSQNSTNERLLIEKNNEIIRQLREQITVNERLLREQNTANERLLREQNTANEAKLREYREQLHRDNETKLREYREQLRLENEVKLSIESGVIANLRAQIVELQTPNTELRAELRRELETERARMNDVIETERERMNTLIAAEQTRLCEYRAMCDLRMSEMKSQHEVAMQLLREQADKGKYITRLGTSIEEHFADFTSTLEPLKTMMSTNKGKGNFGEEHVEEIIRENFPTCDMSDVSKRGKSGDRMFILDGLRFIVEVKNVAKISTDLINEFIAVVERRKNEVQCCVMVSLRAPFPGKGRLHIEVNGNCIVGYVQLTDASALTCLVEVMKQYSITVRNMIVSRSSNESLYTSLLSGITDFINSSLVDFTEASSVYVQMRQQMRELLQSIEDGDKRILDIKNRLNTFVGRFSQIKLRENTFITPKFTDDELRKIRDMKKKRTIENISAAIGRDKAYIKARGKIKDIIELAKKYESDGDDSDSSSSSSSESD